MQPLQERIFVLIEQVLGQQGFDVVDVCVYCHRRDTQIQVFVDRPQGGITLDECTQASRIIESLFTQESWIPPDYVLEVSSPGLDRPLMREKDFIRSQGREIVCYLKEPIQGRRQWQGVVRSVSQGRVCLQHADQGEDVVISLECINQARYVF